MRNLLVQIYIEFVLTKSALTRKKLAFRTNIFHTNKFGYNQFKLIKTYTAQKIKCSIKDYFSKCDITEKILNGKLQFLCSDKFGLWHNRSQKKLTLSFVSPLY